jgi:hypothetical protein
MTFKLLDKLSVLTSLFLIMGVACFGQPQTPNKDSLISIKFKCIDSLILKIPSGQFLISTDSYEEGYLYSIVYSDSSYIIILCGSNADLDINNKTINLYNRKEKVQGHTIIYEGVKKSRLSIFNHAFDLITIDRK